MLGDFGIKWVMVPGPVSQALSQRLDASVGLVPVSKAPAYDLWQVSGPVARVRVVAKDGTVTPLAAQPVGMTAVSAPAAGGTLVLAEPYGGWTATLGGTALKPLPAPVNGWAQGFTLPPGGGQLVITRNDLARNVSLIAELVAVLAICVLALAWQARRPGRGGRGAGRAARRAARQARRPYRQGIQAGRAPGAARAFPGRAGCPGYPVGSSNPATRRRGPGGLPRTRARRVPRARHGSGHRPGGPRGHGLGSRRAR